MAYIRVTDDDIRQAKKGIYKDMSNPWDPAAPVYLNILQDHAAGLMARLDKLKADPGLPRRQKYKNLLYFIGMVLIWIYPLYLNFRIIIIFASLTCFFSLVPFILVLIYYRGMAADLIKFWIALKRKWLYDPDQDFEKHEILRSRYWEIFSNMKDALMSKAYAVDDQLWGTTARNSKNFDFYSGTILIQGLSNGLYFFSHRLEKRLNTRFFLYPEFTKLSQEKGKEINTESIAFNKLFAFSYKGSKDEKSLDIVRVLSPAVQTKLLNMRNSKGKFYVLFAEDCVIFKFNRLFLYNTKTNVFKSPELHPDDLAFFDEFMSEIIDISSEMAKYMD